MVIGVLQVELGMPWAESLKDKRRVVRSLKDRLHREHQASVAEVAAHEIATVARLGVAVVTADGARAGRVLDAITEKCRAVRDAEFVAGARQIIHGSEIDLHALGGEDDQAGGADVDVMVDSMLARGEAELAGERAAKAGDE